MKNQYFGDTRDLFKYDLIHHVVKELRHIGSFLFIPMLTRDDGRNDGGKKDYRKAKAGTQNILLVSHLENCLKDGKRNISEIKSYFINNGIDIKIHKEEHFLEHKNRSSYFESMDKKLLLNSLIFLDPDNGLETKNPNEKHVLYSEIKDIYDKMNEKSVIMIYQHFPRVDRQKHIKNLSKKLDDKVGAAPLFVSDNQIVFFFLTNGKVFRQDLNKVLSTYSKTYDKLSIGS